MNFKSYYLNLKKIFSDNLLENDYFSSNVVITEPSDDPRKVLVIFPLNQDIFRVASYIFREIPYSKKNAQFHYIIRDDYSDYFNVRNGILYKVNLMNNKSDIDFEKFPNNIKFDMVINLNIDFNSNISTLIAHVQSNYKIGFKHKDSDLLYNIQIDITKNGIVEDGYKQIRDLI